MKRFTSLLAALLLGAFVPAHADILLKQSTASQAVKLGPFVDSTDGNSEETALTIANTDIKCSKNGGALASKNSGGGTHDANGWYTVTFDATDTNTVGRFQCFVHVSGALPVTFEANIVEEAIYDALYAASANAYTGAAGSTVARADLINIAGAAVSTSTAQLGVNVVNLAGSAVSASSGVANVNVAQVSTDSTAADTLETWLDGTAGNAIPLGIVDQGTAQSATGTTLVLRSALAMADDTANGMTIVACGSTQGYCQARTVTDYTSTTDTATVDTWTVTPSGTITYYLFSTAPGSAGSAPTASQNAAAVWDELLSGHTTSGSAGERLGRIPNVAAAANGGLPTVDANNAVKVQSGTGANQISLSSGAVLLQATQTGVTIPTVTTVGTTTNLTNAPTSGDLTSTMKTSVATAVQTAQGIIAGTCSSGSTTTCVDAARTEADATQLQDRLICFNDGWCAMLTTFNPASDTATTTKTAPTTRASKTYIIFPATAQ